MLIFGFQIGGKRRSKFDMKAHRQRMALEAWWIGVNVRLARKRQDRARISAAARKGAVTKRSKALARAQEMFGSNK